MGKVSHMRSYFFGPSIVIVSRISRMIDNGYFGEGMGCESIEETIPEPNTNEGVVLRSSLLLVYGSPRTLCLPISC
jgi:hypothetical protein